MNLKFIFVFYLFRINEVMSSSEEETIECVKRKSGTCKAFNVTEDFDRFFELTDPEYSTDTIFEFDYFENKHSYEREQSKNEEGFDTSDNPVIEILFKRHQESNLNYRLVLGEKLNRLAYLDLSGYDYTLYNNYSPDLPSWPFAINVTININLSVHTRDGDGLNNPEPFLEIPDILSVKQMSVRNRNRNVKIVGFYDCSTKYGANCGTVRTETISDCREKFSALGSGFFKTFVNIGDFNRSNNKTGEFELDEVFGVYRRNNDSCVILFSPAFFEIGKYIRITIGDGIGVRVRTVKEGSEKHFRKDVIIKGWNQEPSHPNFIRIKISSVGNNISIYNIQSEIPILTMGLCNYFEGYQERRMYMSITSDRFKTVDVYYDCCSPSLDYTCHIYEHNRSQENSTTIRRSETEIYHSDEDVENEVEFLDNSEKMVKTFLDTSDFRGPISKQYVYDETLNETEYCEPVSTHYFYDETLNVTEYYESETDVSVVTTTNASNTGD